MPTRPITTLLRRTAIAVAALTLAGAATGAAGARAAATFANPVLPGDRNDVRERSVVVALHLVRYLLEGREPPR